MSATTLYVKACRCLYSNESDESWQEMLTLLPQIRSALSCRVCRGLIVDPQCSKYCQHYVCRECLKKKKALNPGCKWCLDWSKLGQSDRQIRVVLACYKLLCETIKSSPFYKNSVNDANIDKLLNEAISNQDELPESTTVPTNDSRILLGTLENTPAALGSRDVGACARENKTKSASKSKRSRIPGIKRKVTHSKPAEPNGKIKRLINIAAVSEQNSNDQIIENSTPEVVQCDISGEQDSEMKHKSLGSVEVKHLIKEARVTNNEAQQPLTDNYTVTCQNMNSFPKTRKRNFVSSRDPVRLKKKRNIQQKIGNMRENITGIRRSINKGWKGKPPKQYKMCLDNYNERCISIKS